MQSLRTVEFWNRFYQNHQSSSCSNNEDSTVISCGENNNNNNNHNDDDDTYRLSNNNVRTTDKNDATDVEDKVSFHDNLDKTNVNKVPVTTSSDNFTTNSMSDLHMNPTPELKNENKNFTNSSSIEWILEPSTNLFDFIIDNCIQTQQHDNDNVYRILEIGCGNSNFAIEMFNYMKKLQKGQQQEMNQEELSLPEVNEEQGSVVNESTIQQNRRKIPKTIQFWATDVSYVCIEQNQLRDSDVVNVGSMNQQQSTSETFHIDESNHSISFFQYNVLDVTQDHSHLNNQFDLILDKGCFDTFLFRSKNRGGKGAGAEYADLIEIVLDNIQSWLKCGDHRISIDPFLHDDSTSDNNINTKVTTSSSNVNVSSTPTQDTTTTHNKITNNSNNKNTSNIGTYCIFSSRSKHKSLRDYLGFIINNVQRHEIDLTRISLGSLEGNRTIEKSTNHINNKKKKNIEEDKHGRIFMYVCTKNDQYSAQRINLKNDERTHHDDNNIHEGNNSNKNDRMNDHHYSTTTVITKSLAFAIDNIITPNDNDICLKCHITFYEFRKGENIREGRGERFWFRQWKGHCQHCKN